MLNTDIEIKNEIIEMALNFYNKLCPLGQDFKIEFLKHAELIKLYDQEVLVEQGNVCPAFYFIGKGMLIGESVHDKKKMTVWFSKAGGSGTSITGLYGNTTSEERIYAYGETIIIAVANEQILKWYDEYPAFNTIMRKMFEYYLQSSQQRAGILRMGTARQKISFFKKAYSDYLEVTPLNIIACFLGIKISTLEYILKEEKRCINKELELVKNYKTIIDFLDLEKPYLQTSITLKVLANRLSLSPHILSETINKKCNQNFNDFINTYRVKYVKERLNRENWQHLKLESLGIEAGFKSRSTFFSVFKRQVGESPLIFLKSKIKDN